MSAFMYKRDMDMSTANSYYRCMQNRNCDPGTLLLGSVAENLTIWNT